MKLESSPAPPGMISSGLRPDESEVFEESTNEEIPEPPGELLSSGPPIFPLKGLKLRSKGPSPFSPPHIRPYFI